MRAAFLLDLGGEGTSKSYKQSEESLNIFRELGGRALNLGKCKSTSFILLLTFSITSWAATTLLAHDSNVIIIVADGNLFYI